MKRRQFVERVGLGAAAMVAVSEGPMSAALGRQEARQDEHHGHGSIDGPLAAAAVSFGAWPASAATPLDRMNTPDAPVAPNVHQLIPNTVTIKAGGAVRYTFAGFHQILVYAPGTNPRDIDTTTLLPIPGLPPTVGLIDDPRNRIYRGVSPLTVPQDRVEVVHFGTSGLYLVMCAVSVHFADGMFGWVRVLR